MAKRTAKEIIQKKMPGVEIVEGAAGAAAEDARGRRTLQSGASIEQLRAKYLGADAEARDASRPYAVEDSDDDDIEVVRVRPKQVTDPSATGPAARTVIVSKNEGKILGAEG